MSKKILIVDDNEEALKLLRIFLKKNNFHVFCAGDGAKGYELVKKLKPDILITDMLIPKIHGLDLCRKVKDDPALRKIKVILMSGVYKRRAFRDDIEDSSADCFIKKPIDLKRLKSLIEKYLSEKKEEKPKEEPKKKEEPAEKKEEKPKAAPKEGKKPEEKAEKK